MLYYIVSMHGRYESQLCIHRCSLWLWSPKGSLICSRPGTAVRNNNLNVLLVHYRFADLGMGMRGYVLDGH